MRSPCDLCAAIDPTGPGGPLRQHLRPDQPARVGHNAHAAAVPTIGAFLPGYLLIVPVQHTTSLGLLPEGDLDGVQQLAEQMADRLQQVYGGSVLGFEYGLNLPGGRRIEHGHLHLLPTAVGGALRHYLSSELLTVTAGSLRELPSSPDRSYICVWEPHQPVSIYPVANHASPRIRLREVVAQLDPRVPGHAWDWKTYPCSDLMRATVEALVPSPCVLAGRPVR